MLNHFTRPLIRRETHRALVLSALDKPLFLPTLPGPSALAGEVIVRKLATYILPTHPQS